MTDDGLKPIDCWKVYRAYFLQPLLSIFVKKWVVIGDKPTFEFILNIKPNMQKYTEYFVEKLKLMTFSFKQEKQFLRKLFLIENGDNGEKSLLFVNKTFWDSVYRYTQTK